MWNGNQQSANIDWTTRVPVQPDRRYPNITLPQPINVKQGGSSVGRYMRETLIYFYEHVKRMNRDWQNDYIFVQKAGEGITNAASSQAWWNRATARMIKECAHLAKIRDEITTCGEYLCLLHKMSIPSSWVGHRNLQRRSLYLLELCLNALCDLRALHTTARIRLGTTAKPINIPNINVQKGDMSGLNPNSNLISATEPYRNFAVQVAMEAPYIYTERHYIKVPAHFTGLMTEMYGAGHPVDVRQFRTLLARYAMFLCYIIWLPTAYDGFYRCVDYQNFAKIFDITPPPNPDALDAASLDANFDRMPCHRCYLKVTDDQMTGTLQKQPWVTSQWNDYMCELQRDGTTINEPGSSACFRHFVVYDRKVDGVNCPQTAYGCWMRVFR